jgi:predicted nucleotidyltransferase component of viral defense system
MIKTSKQLKDKVRNMSGSDSTKAQTYIRNFIMERFLERIAVSPYRNHFVLKGGMLVAAVIGMDMRATMDIDTTVQSLTLTTENAKKIIEDIIAVDIQDGVEFRITKISDIMEEHDYPGVRFVLESMFDHMRQVIKIDISTGDIITPSAVEFSYKLMFEERFISLLAYNTETLLAEKLETIMARGTTNTRMRDFYDIHIICQQKDVDGEILKRAFQATSKKRGTTEMIGQFSTILENIGLNGIMQRDWENYKRNSFFVGDLTWEDLMQSIKSLAVKVCNNSN